MLGNQMATFLVVKSEAASGYLRKQASKRTKSKSSIFSPKYGNYVVKDL
jgi:hypothetical protein